MGQPFKKVSGSEILDCFQLLVKHQRSELSILPFWCIILPCWMRRVVRVHGDQKTVAILDHLTLALHLPLPCSNASEERVAHTTYPRPIVLRFISASARIVDLALSTPAGYAFRPAARASGFEMVRFLRLKGEQ
jgi:hypothetical protein